MRHEAVEWVVEYLGFYSQSNEPTAKSKKGMKLWIRSVRNGKCISPLSIAEAMKIAKKRGEFNLRILEYRIRNLRTGDILPEAIL